MLRHHARNVINEQTKRLHRKEDEYVSHLSASNDKGTAGKWRYADKKTIAQNILSYDFSQVEYYEGITNNMVGRVLRKNEIVLKDKNNYELKLFEDLSSTEIT